MTNQMKTDAWGTKFHEAQTLRKQGASMLHQRITLLVEVHADREFQAWCSENNIVALDYLDDHLEDVGFNFLTLEAVLHAHPQASDWQKHNIRQLCAMVIESQKRVKDSLPRKNWRKLAEQLERENEILTARLEEMQKLIDMMQPRASV